MHTVDLDDLAGLLIVPLAVPTLELASDVPLVAAEIDQPAGIEIDRMDRSERVDERLGGPTARHRSQRVFCGGSIAQDVPVDEAHHVERRIVDRLIGAQPERRRYRHGRAL